MVLREVCLLLAVAALAQGDGHDELCSRVAFEPLPKHLTCGTDCTAENVSVVWSFYKSVPPVTNATFRYGIFPHAIHGSSIKYESVEVLADGRLRIGTVKEGAHKGGYSCTAQFSNGTVCGMTDSFSLRVTQLFTDLSQSPSFKPERDTDATYGLRKVLCVDGDSPGIDENRTYWEKTDVVNVVVNNISAECLSTYPTLCYSCDDQNKYLSLPTVMNQTMNYEYSAFVIASRHIQGDTKHNECLDITNTYVSFLVINEVKNEDKGTFKVIIESGYNTRNAEGPYTLLPSYITIESEVQDLTDKKIDAGENAYVICNATHSVNPAPSLHWKFIGVNPDKSVLDIPSTVVTNVNRSSLDNISISDDKLSELCNNYTDMLGDRYVAFSINFAPNEELYENSIDHGNAVIQRRYLVLVLCNVTKEQDGTYTCVAPLTDSSAKSEKIMEVTVFDDTPTVVVRGSTSTNPAAIAGVVVAAVIIVCMMVLLVAWGVRRYHLLKYEAMQMRPMSIPLAATQLTNAINHAFASFSPIGSPMYDKFEFPRENLVFLEVIGEGQFGQVWRARAIGICSEDSRNIVAVKTLKENYRDADYYDLRSELDIMRSMEPHPNIINLLGVCAEIAMKPMCILMEYAAYGSMKDYLAYCRRVMQAHAAGLASPTLEEAYPSAAASNGAILRQSMLVGDYPQLQPLGMGNDYHYDPMVASRNRRLVQMLKLEGFKPNLTDDDASYNHLAPHAAGANAAGLSPYDQLYPQSQCVYRPCLETYNYACYRGVQQLKNDASAEQEYYNSPAGEFQGEITVTSGDSSPPVFASPEPPPPLSPRGMQDTVKLIQSESSPSPVQITDSTAAAPPDETTPVRKKTKVGAVLSVPHVLTEDKPRNLTSISASQDNVFEDLGGSSNLLAPSKEHLRESMISFPDGYIYAPASTVHGGHSVSRSVGDMDHGAMGGAMERKEKEPAPLMEDMITHLDLLDFSVQIARGMDHLQRMQCVHRDLAARNILISEDFTLKIGDFGLARDLSDKDYYRKVTPGRLPARWMAPESLEERTHTFQSDVWSYGVVLWEIVSYGEVPYRGQQEANDCDHLAYYLRSGNRLELPPNASDEFRDLMSSCWAWNPDKRPTFSEVISILDNQLSAAHGYLAMASAPADRVSVHDPGSTNPSPRMQKRKAMLQKLDALHGADRPVSLQPGAFSKSKLAKSPSLPIAEPLSTSSTAAAPPRGPAANAAPATTVSPYILPTPTLKVPGSLGTQYRFGSNPELSLSGKEMGGGREQGEHVKVNGVGVSGHAPGETLTSIETQL